MRSLLLAVLLLPALRPAARAQDDDAAPVSRRLAGVALGDDLERVQRVYPPANEWPATTDDRTGAKRYRLKRGDAKGFPARVETLYFGFKLGRLVEIEIVYDQKRSRVDTVGKLAGDYALDYGEAKRSGDRFWWSDKRTVLRVFPAEIPLPKDGAHAVAWRTAVQVFDRGLEERAEQD